MGKTQKKTGKNRLDKYYKLAKEQGYRARSAFKLIQLNKKYSFLGGARVCIDLCAAPGGWLQVASKYMPVNSVIIGVDLVPIKPIPRVVTFASDITTPQCRNLIRGELKDWKADVVLHDGAPNVGTAWVHDAYSQSELVLMSLKLAVEFLTKGGTFITKVFRSADYNNLIWVFNQLFGKVEATKPPSSRNVSAEIFVVCREFLAPKQIDPKFLDPKHVFKELASATATSSGIVVSDKAQANVFQPEKKRRQRDGYEDGNYTLHKTGKAIEFVKEQDPVAFLGSVNQIVFKSDEEKEWLSLDITTLDVKTNCEDLKVLGKGDFKVLMKWRSALREHLGLDVKVKPSEEFTETAQVEEMDNDEQVMEDLERLNAEAAAAVKRQRRKANEIKTKTIQRMQLQMTAPTDIGLDLHDASLGGQADLFDLEDAERRLPKKKSVSKQISTLDDGDSIDDDDDDDDEDGSVLGSDIDDEGGKVDGLEDELDGLYDAYRERKQAQDAKFRVKEARDKDAEREKWNGIKKQDSDDEGDSDMSDAQGGWDRLEQAKIAPDSDSSSDEESDEDERVRKPVTKKRPRDNAEDSSKKSTKKPRLVKSLDERKTKTSLWFEQDVFEGMNDLDVDDEDIAEGMEVDVQSESEEWEDESESEPASRSEDESEDEPPSEGEDAEDDWDVADEDINEKNKDRIQKHGLTTAEAVTLAQQLVNRQKTMTEMINDGFNRYSLNSKEGLPAWFLDDESKYYKSNIPITKEAVAALRAKQRQLDARPIKKVAEAKARKKFKAVQKLEKARKKAEGVNEMSDLTEREKAKQIEKLMSKGTSGARKKKPERKLVVAKGPNRGLKGRPKGVKGKYTMVDSRMKKEVRAQKRRDKAAKKGGGRR